MKRQDLKDLGIEEKEVIDKIMALYGDGVESAKTDMETLKQQLADKDKSIQELNEQIKAFSGTDTELQAMRDKVASFEKAENDRKEAEKQSQIDADLKSRFMAVVGENKFKHADIENGRFAAFKDSLAKDEFKGKGDSDIFAEITKDMDCFVNPQQQTITMPGGNVTNTNLDGVERAFMQRNPGIKF